MESHGEAGWRVQRLWRGWSARAVVVVRLVGKGSGCGEAGWQGQWLWRGWLARAVVVVRLVGEGSGCGEAG